MSSDDRKKPAGRVALKTPVALRELVDVCEEAVVRAQFVADVPPALKAALGRVAQACDEIRPGGAHRLWTAVRRGNK